MHQTRHHHERVSALASAALLLLACCLLAGSAGATPTPRYVVGDVLEVDFVNSTGQIVIARVDTTSLPEPYYTAFPVEQHAGQWEIPRYWHRDLEYTEEQLLGENARRVAHVDPVNVIITDPTIIGGFMQYMGLSLAEALAGVLYPVEPDPGNPNSFPPSYVVGDILGNATDPNRGAVVSRSFEQDGVTWYNLYLDTVRSGDRWMIEKFYNGDMRFPTSALDGMGMRRVAHADPHIVIVNDTTTSTGEMGWYRLSLAEVLDGKIYDHMGYWHFVTGDILGSQTNATRYIVGSANTSDSGPSHYTLYQVVRPGDGWAIPAYVNAGIPLETGLVQLDGIPFDFVDHTDPHFAVVTDPSVADGITFQGLSLGEILEGTPGYPPETGPVVLPVPGGAGLPRDVNGDSLYEDINGNNRGDFADVVLYFNQMTWIAANEPLSAFDYNANGRIDFADVVWLFDHLGDVPAGRTYTVMAAAVGPGEIAPAGNVTVREGENITFSLINRGTLPTPYATQSGYVVRNEVRVDPSVVPTPYPFPLSGGSWSFTPSYTLTDVRANHTVYGVFSYIPITC